MKRVSILLSIVVALSMLLAACAPKTAVPTEAPVVVTEAPVATEAPVLDPADIAASLPRNETLYFNGQQWGPVVCWNPYSSNCNNAMAIAQQDSARVIMFETPYLYNMLDGKSYPLLADGDYVWNAERTEITFKIKAAAKWSDGTPVTAEDVAYTWASNVKYETNAGVNYQRLHRQHRSGGCPDRQGHSGGR